MNYNFYIYYYKLQHHILDQILAIAIGNHSTCSQPVFFNPLPGCYILVLKDTFGPFEAILPSYRSSCKKKTPGELVKLVHLQSSGHVRLVSKFCRLTRIARSDAIRRNKST